MGQYQQWLLYQETEKRLRAQLEALEIELAQLEEDLHLLEQAEEQHEQPVSPADNPIIQALATSLNKHNTPPNSTSGHAGPVFTSLPLNVESARSQETLSHALLNWGRLPDFGPHEIGGSLPNVEKPLPPNSHPEIELLPEDMKAFFDEHERTDPQLELPWWLRNITVSAKNNHGARPIDQESIRTNRLVKRWIERWGRQSSTSLESEEGGRTV